MTKFWLDLDLSDVQSPRQILEAAREEWQKESGGVLELIMQESVSAGESLIIVHAKELLDNRTVALFTVRHREDAPYPATIELDNDDLPNHLKKSYYQEGFAGMTMMSDRQVTNEWVSETPGEFRNKLASALRLGNVKAEVLNLLATREPDATRKVNVKESE